VRRIFIGRIPCSERDDLTNAARECDILACAHQILELEQFTLAASDDYNARIVFVPLSKAFLRPLDRWLYDIMHLRSHESACVHFLSLADCN
jgi:hypothetical protein